MLLVACDAGTAPAPVVAPVQVAAPRDAAPSDASPFAACSNVPQPAKWNHTSVEPDDMLCIHGDTAYSCPADFDGRAHGCDRATRGDVWCCR